MDNISEFKDGNTMTHASLFSGIGGAELAASWVGWYNKFHCDINEFGNKVIRYHFPNSKEYGDITKTDFREWRGRIDVLTGGFPCQPFSVAGKRKGKEDDRYLWPEMLRAIREIQPTWVVGENVGGIVSMVQPGTEVEMGGETSLFEEDYYTQEEQEYVIETICKSIENEGYSVQPILIPACAVGAPHRRDRVWFIANREDARNESGYKREKLSCKCRITTNPGLQRQTKSKKQTVGNKQLCESRAIANTESKQSKRMQFEQRESGEKEQGEFRGIYCKNDNIPDWSSFPTQSPICSGDDGLSDRLDGITFPTWRNESIKAYGNAWVPQVAYEIFKIINQIEHEKRH